MAEQFESNKRYKFSKDIYLLNPVHAVEYKQIPKQRRIIDSIDGVEVTVGNEYMGMTASHIIKPEWCEELPSAGYLRSLCIQVLDKLYGEKEKGEAK